MIVKEATGVRYMRLTPPIVIMDGNVVSIFVVEYFVSHHVVGGFDISKFFISLFSGVFLI